MGVLSRTHLVVNERAPVRAYRKYDEGGSTRDFKDLAAFEAWLSPRHHGVVGVNSQFLFTDVLLEQTSDPPDLARGRHVGVVGQSSPGYRPPGGPRKNHRVDVDGVVHGSVYKAFEKLGLPIDAHVKFRNLLKQNHELSFTHAGKQYNFKLVE